MKNILFFLLINLFALNVAQSQTLHAIIFANTKSPGNPNDPNDRGIGPSVTVDFERIQIEMTTISKFIGYNLKKYYYYDTPDRFSKSSLESVLNNLQCNSKDIVFFYYSGHGLRAANENTKFPEMVLKVPYGSASINDLFPLYDVYKKIKNKKPRLTIVLGDLCNSTVKGFYRKYDGAKGYTVKSDNAAEIYKNLFLEARGGLIATSSKPGQTSGCASFSDGTDAGGNFTASFLQCLQEVVRRSNSANWKSLLNATIALTQDISSPDRLTGEKQTPVYDDKDLSYTSIPEQYSTTSNQITTTANDAQTTKKDDLADVLTYIGCSKNSIQNRIKRIPEAQNRFFAKSNAMVQVVGRDSKTIVNTMQVGKYLNYLSIATNIENVIVLESMYNSSEKIQYLKVHEIHNK